MLVKQGLHKLRERASVLIREGRLPAITTTGRVEATHVPHSTECSLCNELIKAGEFQYVVHGVMTSPTPQEYGLHFLCHAAWQFEAAEAEQESRLPASA